MLNADETLAALGLSRVNTATLARPQRAWGFSSFVFDAAIDAHALARRHDASVQLESFDRLPSLPARQLAPWLGILDQSSRACFLLRPVRRDLRSEADPTRRAAPAALPPAQPW